MKHSGVIIFCGACGVETPKIRSNSRFCPAAKCKAISKQGLRVPQVEIECIYCETAVVRRNTRQVTCGSDECQDRRQKEMKNNARPRMRTGASFKCDYCPTVLVRIQSNQVTCGADACRKLRKKERDDGTFWMLRRRAPVLCGVCERPIRVKRLRFHPPCYKQLANDKRRIKRGLGNLRAQKIEDYRNSCPRRVKRTQKRMEVLKCENKLQRTS